MSLQSLFNKVSSSQVTGADLRAEGVTLSFSELTTENVFAINIGLNKLLASKIKLPVVGEELDNIVRGILSNHRNTVDNPNYINIYDYSSVDSSSSSSSSSSTSDGDESGISVDSLVKSDKSGILDKLLGTVKEELQYQFDQNSITDSDYAQLYASSLGTVIQQATSFALSISQVNLDNEIKGKQLEKLNLEKAILEQQLFNERAKTNDYVDGIPIGGTVGLQNDILAQQLISAKTENDILEEKLKAAKYQLSDDVDGVYLNSGSLFLDNSIKAAQRDKLAEEKKILTEKINTEKAQTNDVINGKTVGGLSGKQMQVYHKQARGYDRNAEMEVAKLYAQAFNVIKSADSTTEVAGFGFTSTEIKDALDHAKAGVGISARNGTWANGIKYNANTSGSYEHGHTNAHFNGE